MVLGQAAAIASGLDLDTALPDERKGTLWLDTEQLNGFKLSSVKVAATGSILVEVLWKSVPAAISPCMDRRCRLMPT